MQTLTKTVKSSLGHKELNYQLSKCSDVKKGAFFAVCWDKPSTCYWCKFLMMLRDDDDGDVIEAEVEFLKCSVPSSDPQSLRWDWPKEDDTKVLNVSHILVGPTQHHLENKPRGRQGYYFF